LDDKGKICLGTPGLGGSAMGLGPILVSVFMEKGLHLVAIYLILSLLAMRQPVGEEWNMAWNF
jgi:hypothetical protein